MSFGSFNNSFLSADAASSSPAHGGISTSRIYLFSIIVKLIGSLCRGRSCKDSKVLHHRVSQKIYKPTHRFHVEWMFSLRSFLLRGIRYRQWPRDLISSSRSRCRLWDLHLYRPSRSRRLVRPECHCGWDRQQTSNLRLSDRGWIYLRSLKLHSGWNRR